MASPRLLGKIDFRIAAAFGRIDRFNDALNMWPKVWPLLQA
jgi:hypothetical protein